MEQKYYELFKLQYEKLLNSSKIIYDTISSYNNMAFSFKEMNKEMDLFVQAVLLNKLIKTNQLSTELLVQFSEVFQFGNILKALKYNPKKVIDQKILININKYCESTLAVNPKFIKLGVYFDKTTVKYNLGEKVSYIKIVLNVISSMLALIENIDDQNIDFSIYDSYLDIIHRYIKDR